MEEGAKEVKDTKELKNADPIKEIGKATGIKWNQPGRIEVLLVLIYIFSWYLFNDMFNLLSIEGLSTTGHFFNGLEVPAAFPFAISFVVMIAMLLTFVVRSTFDKSSHRLYNTIIGIWIFFGTILMVIAMVLMLQGFGPAYNVTWLLNLSRNSIYHIGVFLFQIPGVIYFALFD